MQKFLIKLFIMFVMLFASCKGQEIEKERLGSFDLSPNDKQIVFSYTKNRISSIYTTNIDGTNTKIIIGSKDDINYYNPKYSSDGKTILFIKNKKDSFNSTLCISNADGSSIQFLTGDEQIITEAIFSINGEEIYYCKANVYEKYSPIGRRDAHDFDIYSINLKDNIIKKVSNLKSYGLSNISEVDNYYILFRLGAGPDSGIFLYSKDSSLKSSSIVPINNPKQDASLYYTPIYSHTSKLMAFTTPYELYVMDINERVESLVFSNKGKCNMGGIIFYKRLKKILFSKTCSSDFYSINIDGTDLQTIPIIIK